MDGIAIRLVENPLGLDDEYLRGFNVCFRCTWTRDCLAWYIHRPFASRHPDVAVLFEGDQLIAGLATNYRQLKLARGRIANVGILTGGWTLPAHRRKRHFTRLIETLTRTAKRRGCLAVLGFVMNENGSATALRRAGAYRVPAHYLYACSDADLQSPALGGLGTAARESHRDAATVVFHYPTEAAWADQFLHRPWSTSQISIDGGLAVLEHAGETDRLQYMAGMPSRNAGALTEIALLSRRKHRSFFSYTTSSSLARRAEECGMQRTPGSMYILEVPGLHPSGNRALVELRAASWLVQAGDRM